MSNLSKKIMIAFSIFLLSAFALGGSKSSDYQYQAYIDLHKPYKQCKSNAYKYKYWQLTSQCMLNKKKDCMHRISHEMLSLSEEEIPLKHCEVLKPGINQLRQRADELKKGLP